MASATRVRNSDRSERSRRVTEQPHRFAGLFLSPIAGLFGSWAIHYWTRGVDIRWGDFAWTVTPSPAASAVAVFLIAVATIGLAVLGYRFASHREAPKQWALAGSIFVVGAMFAINVGTGPHYWWSGLLIIAGWVVAAAWSIARLDVARNDKRENDEDREDGLLKKLGISKLTRFRPKVIHDEETGEPVRLEVPVEHAKGETVEVLQDGISTLESAVAGPPGMSTATEDPDRADRSTLTLMLKNPFKKNIPVGPLTSPGGSVADWSSVADYADGKPALVTFAAGKHMASSTSFALIGMTRSGKTGTETQLLTEHGSRIDWACLYLNQAKGLQDIRPVLPVIEAAVIAEDGEAGHAEYVTGYEQIKKNVMAYRQQELARFSISAWSPRCADPNPDRRPTRLGANGKRIIMEPMPFLTVFSAEADSILASGKASDLAVHIASKGLSLGVNSGWSLQRPDWKAMPTSLRANIGTWFVHGLNGSDEEEFVLDEDVRKAGARPGKWGQRRPGQHYMVGPGIDDDRFPVALKTRFLIGSATDAKGAPIDFDTLNDRYMAEMLRRNLASAPRMAKLDRGSAESTGGWWDAMALKTDDMRRRMLDPVRYEEWAERNGERIEQAREGFEAARKASTAPASSPRRPSGFAGVPNPQVADHEDDEDEDLDPAEKEELMQEFDDEAADTVEVDGYRIYGETPEEEAETRAVDLYDKTTPPAGDFDPLAESSVDDKPAAESREQAVAELRNGLVRMIDMPQHADPKVPGAALVTPTSVLDELNLRSRPWVSQELARIMISGGGVEDGVSMERVGDPRKGVYRLQRTDGKDHSE